ncbi:MAG: hypothetical protein ACE5LS_07310 [Thermoplasmata archaeon]
MAPEESRRYEREIKDLMERVSKLGRKIGAGEEATPSETSPSARSETGQQVTGDAEVLGETGAGNGDGGGDRNSDEGREDKLSKLGEQVRAILAIFIVFFVIFLLALVWFLLGIQDVDRGAIILMPLVTLVLGYYFGTRGTQEAQKRIEEARTELEAAKKSKKIVRTEDRAALADAEALLGKLLGASEGSRGSE